MTIRYRIYRLLLIVFMSSIYSTNSFSKCAYIHTRYDDGQTISAKIVVVKNTICTQTTWGGEGQLGYDFPVRPKNGQVASASVYEWAYRPRKDFVGHDQFKMVSKWLYRGKNSRAFIEWDVEVVERLP